MPSTANPLPVSTLSASPNLQSTETRTCPLCHAPLHNPAACDRCDWVQGYGHAPEMQRHPRDVFAGVLSLFWPGAGHFYKGHTTTAFMLAATGFLCFLWSLALLAYFGFLILPVFWLAVATHAYFASDLKQPVSRPSSPLAHA